MERRYAYVPNVQPNGFLLHSQTMMTNLVKCSDICLFVFQLTKTVSHSQDEVKQLSLSLLAYQQCTARDFIL